MDKKWNVPGREGVSNFDPTVAFPSALFVLKVK